MFFESLLYWMGVTTAKLKSWFGNPCSASFEAKLWNLAQVADEKWALWDFTLIDISVAFPILHWPPAQTSLQLP